MDGEGSQGPPDRGMLRNIIVLQRQVEQLGHHPATMTNVSYKSVRPADVPAWQQLTTMFPGRRVGSRALEWEWGRGCPQFSHSVYHITFSSHLSPDFPILSHDQRFQVSPPCKGRCVGGFNYLLSLTSHECHGESLITWRKDTQMPRHPKQ